MFHSDDLVLPITSARNIYSELTRSALEQISTYRLDLAQKPDMAPIENRSIQGLYLYFNQTQNNVFFLEPTIRIFNSEALPFLDQITSDLFNKIAPAVCTFFQNTPNREILSDCDFRGRTHDNDTFEMSAIATTDFFFIIYSEAAEILNQHTTNGFRVTQRTINELMRIILPFDIRSNHQFIGINTILADVLEIQQTLFPLRDYSGNTFNLRAPKKLQDLVPKTYNSR